LKRRLLPAFVPVFSFVLAAALSLAALSPISPLLGRLLGAPTWPFQLIMEPGIGTCPLLVRFTPPQTAVFHQWDFHYDPIIGFRPEYSTTVGDEVTFTYTRPGNYTIRVRSYFDGTTNVEQEGVVVVEPAVGAPSIALSAGPTSGPAPLAVAFAAVADSFDGTVSAYSWDFNGDQLADASGVSPAATHLFDTPGAYTVTVTATDGRGLGASASVLITVGTPAAGDPPAITSFTPDLAAPLVGDTVRFTAVASPGATGALTEYLWDFDGNGETDLVTATGTLVPHQYEYPGTYRARVVVRDSENLSASQDLNLTVSFDTTTPRCWLMQPRDGTRVWGDAVSLRANVTPGVQVTGIEFKVRLSDGLPFPAPSDASWTSLGTALPSPDHSAGLHWDVTGLTAGQDYDLIAVAATVLGAANSAAIREVRVTVDPANPDVLETGRDNVSDLRAQGIQPAELGHVETVQDTFVDVLPGSIPSYDRMRLERRSDNPHPAEATLQGLHFVPGQFRRTGFENGSGLGRPARVRMYFQHASLANLADRTKPGKVTVKLYRWEPSKYRWEPLADQLSHPAAGLAQASKTATGDLGMVAFPRRQKSSASCGLLGIEAAAVLAGLLLFRRRR